MQIYKLSDIIGRKLAIDRNPFILINDLPGPIINDINFPSLDRDGVDTRRSRRVHYYLPLFTVNFPKEYQQLFVRGTFKFGLIGDTLRTYT
jgi:hypothetical protein